MTSSKSLLTHDEISLAGVKSSVKVLIYIPGQSSVTRPTERSSVKGKDLPSIGARNDIRLEILALVAVVSKTILCQS